MCSLESSFTYWYVLFFSLESSFAYWYAMFSLESSFAYCNAMFSLESSFAYCNVMFSLESSVAYCNVMDCWSVAKTPQPPILPKLRQLVQLPHRSQTSVWSSVNLVYARENLQS